MPLRKNQSVSHAKLAQLSQWGENAHDHFSHMNDSNDDFLPPAEEFETLKLAPGGPSAPSPDLLRRFVEDDKAPGYAHEWGNLPPAKNNVFFEKGTHAGNFALSGSLSAKSPGANSLMSPIGKDSLGDYSEDTDITEMDGEGFEEIDDIFGKEESGIYSSGGAKRGASISNAGSVLEKKRKQLEKEAEIEDQELFSRYQRQHDHSPKTVKLRPLKEADDDFWRSDRATLKEEFEPMDDGFGELPQKLPGAKIKSGFSLPRKASMPALPRAADTFSARKFRSTMNLNGKLADADRPKYSDDVIRKLNRMPSFHSKKEVHKEPKNEVPSDDVLDHNMEMHKKKLLEKYMEITEKQMQLRTSPRKHASPRKPPKKGVGLVRYLNDMASVPVTGGNQNMKYNAAAKTWEGNDHDLLRFDDRRSSPKKQPSLITSAQFRQSHGPGEEKMVYDAENRRWVNLDAADSHDDVFGDVPDLVPNDIPQYASAKSVPRPDFGERGASTFTQRTTSTVVSAGRAKSPFQGADASPGEEFIVSDRILAKFEKEEQKIWRKTHNWFGQRETYSVGYTGDFSTEYFWEIRKMVMGNDANV